MMRAQTASVALLGLGLLAACGRLLGEDSDRADDPADRDPDGGVADGGRADRDDRRDGQAGTDARADAAPSCGGARPDGAFVAFVTSGTYQGSAGGAQQAAGLDAICQSVAEGASLPGRFVAYAHPLDDDRAPVSAAGWVRVDGEALFRSTDKLPMAPLEVTELCTTVGDDAGAWVGAIDGKDNCTNWSNVGFQGIYGDPRASDATWRKVELGSCVVPRHLYCFQTAP